MREGQFQYFISCRIRPKKRVAGSFVPNDGERDDLKKAIEKKIPFRYSSAFYPVGFVSGINCFLNPHSFLHVIPSSPLIKKKIRLP